MRFVPFLFVAAGVVTAALPAGVRASNVSIIDFEPLTVAAPLTSVSSGDGRGPYPVTASEGGATANASVVVDASGQSHKALGVDRIGTGRLDVDLSSCVPGNAGNGELISLRVIGTTKDTHVIFRTELTTKDVSVPATGLTGSTVVGAGINRVSKATVLFDGGGAIDDIAYFCGNDGPTPTPNAPAGESGSDGTDSVKDGPLVFDSEIAARLDGAEVAAGGALWFSSTIKVRGVRSVPVTIRVTGGSIDADAFHADVPDAIVTFSPLASQASTAFDADAGAWRTTVPARLRGNVWTTGVVVPLPAGLPAGAKSATWSANFSSDTPGVSVRWRWSAAAYSELPTELASLQVKPVDSRRGSAYANRDRSGTPQAFRELLVPGSRSRFSDDAAAIRARR